jgi:hypothetical protein
VSMQYCEECNKSIDTDFNSEHFISEYESKELAERCSESLTEEETELLA